MMQVSGNNNYNDWYVLRTLTDGPAYPTSEWRAWAVEAIECATCRELKQSTGPVDLPVRGIGDRRAALNYVDGFPDLHLAKLEFLGLFDEWLHEGAHTGKVLDESKGQLLSYATLTPKGRRVILRGGPSSQYRGRCSVCGCADYLMIGGPLHVLRLHLGPQHLYVVPRGLLVDHELLSRVGRSRWHKLSVARVRVVDEPLDGYPAEL